MQTNLYYQNDYDSVHSHAIYPNTLPVITMSNIELDQRRSASYSTPMSSYSMKGSYIPTHTQALRAQPYMQQSMMGQMGQMGGQADPMAALTNGLGGMNLQTPSFTTGSTARSVSQTSAASSYEGGVAINANGHPVYMHQQQHNFVYPAAHMLQGAQAHHGLPTTSSMYTPTTAHYVQQPGFQNYTAHLAADNSPHGQGQGWTPRVASGELPTLVTPRRDSISSNENDLPGTPYTTYGPYNNGGVAVIDRSPSGTYTHSNTPSPSQLVAPYILPQLKVQAAQSASNTPLEIQMLVSREPAIPRAIPAPSSPAKPLDRALENRNGETNVYIRGLLPETTDEMLHSWGSRFGDIASSKSIIDLKTNLCKGFGFIKYHNFEDAERCIRGFHHLGYEVSFARESFYAKLKKFQDESNTNLYVSNIPRNMNEHELTQVFSPHEVCSARILRDSSGNGRGVGFARFKSREACEQVIKDFNNTPIAKEGHEEHIIQIRYSDTHEQKLLKQQTAAARQFRAAEFEYGVTMARQGRVAEGERLSSLTADDQAACNEFEAFMASQNNAPSYAPPCFGAPSFPAFRFNTAPLTGFSTVPRIGFQAIPQVNLPTATKTEGNDAAIKTETDTSPTTPTVTRGESTRNSTAGSDRE